MPAVSERQRKAAGAALAGKRKGKRAKGGASRSMSSMSEAQLADFARKPVASPTKYRGQRT